MKISISTPLVATNFQAIPVDAIPQDYSQEIAADGGYKSATISFPIDMSDVGYWLTYGLGSHVQSYGDAAEKIWEGFVNQVSVGFGSLTFGRGPLTEIGNRATIKYTDFTVGQPARTTAANATDSQARYGIWHKAVSVGTISATSADKIRDTYLQENKWPETTASISSSGGDPVLTLNCLGYVEWLNYPYNTAVDTTVTHREKILAVLGQDPNSIFSTDYSRIEANALSVNNLDNDDRLGRVIINELVSLGGYSDNGRRLFGVYDDRTVHLQPVLGIIDYTIKASESGNTIRDARSGVVIEPWNIRPGKWIRILDFSLAGVEPDAGDILYDTGATTMRELRKHPSLIFIESVTFTTPYDFAINGGKINSLTQQLAKLGFG